MISRREFIRSVSVAATLAAAGSVPAMAAGGTGKKPNILFILADDLGWVDTSVTGSKLYETPNIDRLAKRAVYFPNAYTASPLCSPTRASILTGLHPARVGITTPSCHLPEERLEASLREKAPADSKRIECQTATRLKLEYYTLAEALKDAGYATGHFGKWHLGKKPYEPLEQGFDVDLPRWSGPGPAGSYVAPWKFTDFKEKYPKEHIEDRMGDEAVAFMGKHKQGPFFLNYWQFSVHGPFNAKEEYIEEYRQKVDPKNPQNCPTYAAMVKSLDDNVGKMLDALDRLELTDNTIIVFFSDNGGNMYSEVDGTVPTSNAPLRGGKGTMYEGGVRVPCMVVWPGVTRPGTRNESLVESTDWYPTLLEMLGIAKKPNQVFDGMSLVPALRGRELDREVYAYFPHQTKVPDNLPPSVSVRKGDWKLYRLFHENEDQSHKYLLYNLKDDIGEINDLSAKEPERVKEMDELITKFLDRTKAVVPKPNPRYRPGAEDGVGGWVGGKNGHADISLKSRALHIVSTGRDPMITTAGKLSYPAGKYTFELRMKSNADGNGQIFFGTPKKGAVKGSGVNFKVSHDGEWHEYSVEKAVKKSMSLIRLDPCSGEGELDIEWMRLKNDKGAVVKEWRFE